MKKLVRTAITLCLLGIAMLCAFYAIQYYIDKSSEKYMINAESAPNCEAVMVLGAKVCSDGSPSLILEDRLKFAYELYSKGKALKILVSGDHGTTQYDEVNAMKQYLLDKGVPRKDIFMDHAGFDTYDSMYRAKKIFGIKTMLISTQQFHIKRAVYIARKIGIEAYGYPSQDIDYDTMKVLYFRESLAKVKAFIDTDILQRKPKYEGEAIPIMGDGILTDG